MKKIRILLLCLILMVISPQFSAMAMNINEKFRPTKEYFDINLTGYSVYTLYEFVDLIKQDKITPLTKIFFEILKREQNWIFEPRLYVKEDQGYVHIIKKNGLNVLYSIKKKDEHWQIVDIKEKVINRMPVPKDLLQQVLIERLLNHISKAINSYYENGKLWYRGLEKVLSIEKDEAQFIFYVTVQVTTFEGAHNPPYGEETMIFRIKGGGKVELIDFKHREITEKELSKLEAL